MYKVRYLDETISELTPQVALMTEFQRQEIDIAEIIKRRVQQECQKYNDNLASNNHFQHPIEQSLNPNKPNTYPYKTLNWQTQYDKAITAFQKGQLIILVADKQVDELSTSVSLLKSETLDITFIKLVPLVGG